MGTRRIKKRIRNYVEYPDGSRSIPLNAEMQALIQGQLAAFREKFGREPGPEDPIFFDPEADTPQPFDPDRVFEQIIESMIEAGTRHELIYAYIKTERMVTEENTQFLTDEEIEEWNDAINEYRQDARLQRALEKRIAAFKPKWKAIQ